MAHLAALRIHEGSKASWESLAGDQMTGHDCLGKVVAKHLVSRGQTLEIVFSVRGKR